MLQLSKNVLILVVLLWPYKHVARTTVKTRNYSTSSPTMLFAQTVLTKETKNFKIKGKPPPDAIEQASQNHSIINPVSSIKPTIPEHHSTQQGRIARTIHTPRNNSTTDLPVESSAINTQRPRHKLSVTRRRLSTNAQKIETKNYDGTNKTTIISEIAQGSLSNASSLNGTTQKRTRLFHFSGKNVHELVRKRANNAVWAMACLSMLMILLFGMIVYSRLWRRRYSGSWIDNLDTKSGLIQEDSVLAVVKSRARFLPMFFKSKRPDYTPLPSHEHDDYSTYINTDNDRLYDRQMEQNGFSNTMIDSIQEEWDSEDNDDYKPLL